jgi:outer membrane receptor for ferrienterochelin and colicin/copper chaperone CopZ
MKTKYMVRSILSLIFITGISIISFSQNNTLTSVSIQVAGVCGMCEDRIESAALNTAGVQKAEWSSDKQQLQVEVENKDFQIGLLHFNIAAVGHDTDMVQAKQEVYENLPGCCHYRDSVNPHKSESKTAIETKKQSYRVAGICGMCEDRIEGIAIKAAGVVEAQWNAETQFLEVTFEPGKFDDFNMLKKIAAAGHDTDLFEAEVKAYQDLPACCQYMDENNPHKKNKTTGETTQKQSFRVSGVCGMCEDRIEGIALKSSGVIDAQWDAETQLLEVVFENGKFDDSGMLKAIAAAGHETDLFEADEEAYHNLPACCQYTNENNPHYQKADANYYGYILGTVYEKNETGEMIPLIGANLYWAGTSIGTTTDLEGDFELENTGEHHMLVVSYVGYQADTLHAPHEAGAEVDIILSHGKNLDVIEIVHRKKTTEISMIDPIKVHKIGEDELMKAACCNLSESFETNPSIDVGFTDAVTGTRQIEMLGLAGKYVQITRESMPDIRGLSSIHGLTYIPGPWIEGIQMNMGTGSVANGYESITGQINVELKKPEKSDPFYLNLFANQEGRLEANITSSLKLSEKISTAVLLHGNMIRTESDHNGDGFLDMPTGDQIVAVNRWKYVGDNGMMGQIGVKATYVNKSSGEIETDGWPAGINFWKASQKTNRMEAWMKMGKIFKDRPFASIGFQTMAVHHDHSFTFGDRPYDALQQSVYANLIYQSIFGNTNHQYRTGLSFNLDRIEEQVADVEYARSEYVPGAFFEYTFKPDDKFSLVSGMRSDWHSDYGVFFTPRLNIRYGITESTVVRGAVGRGLRTANIFAENIGFFASARNYEIHSDNQSNPYGLEPEVAWNFGLNLTQQFNLFGREGVFSVDAYHTSFQNQVVVDLETTGQISFYNLEGSSYSNSVQGQIDLTVIKNFDIRLAYRYNDVKTQYESGVLQKPLSAKHRAFINLAYATSNNWKFDFTTSWQGQKRIPNTSGNPVAYQLEDYSPSFFLMNAQVSKGWKNVFEVYLGGENLLNFKQANPILAADDPYGEFFDSSLIWGPVFGRKLYVGLRYRIK